jgi:tRNA-specific 2-thiouridylase
LSKTLFPLGELTKPEVRALALKYGLKTAGKEESFEICFVADNNYRRFLRERAEAQDKPLAGGAILRQGKQVGRHDGYPFYTIGQRSGIGAHGERVYVTDIDAGNNTVTIGKNDDLLRTELLAGRLNLVALPALPASLHVEAKVRYKDEATSATVFPADGERCRVVFDMPKRAMTPGQSVVLYDGDLLVGGGIIEQVMPRGKEDGGAENNKG